MNTTIFVLLIILCATSVVKSQNTLISKNALFVLGDSPYDPGNDAFLDPTAPTNRYPYGRSYFASANGRLSDGLILPDFIAIYAGVDLALPYLHPDVDLSDGANFGSAGAGVLPEFAEAMNMDKQLEALKNVSANWSVL